MCIFNRAANWVRSSSCCKVLKFTNLYVYSCYIVAAAAAATCTTCALSEQLGICMQSRRIVEGVTHTKGARGERIADKTRTSAAARSSGQSGLSCVCVVNSLSLSLPSIPKPTPGKLCVYQQADVCICDLLIKRLFTCLVAII